MDCNTKFEIALERLAKEQDTEQMISMNKITRLLQKMGFLACLRKAVPFWYKYVITDADLAN